MLASSRSWAEDPLQGPLVSTLETLETQRQAVLPGLVTVGVVAVGGTLVRAFSGAPDLLAATSVPGMSDAALRDLKLSTAFNNALAPALVLGIGLGFVVGVWLTRRVLERELAPLLVARKAPGVQGGESCRRCGGPLAPSTSAFHRCSYCGSTNLVSANTVHEVYVAAARAQAEVSSPSQAAKRFTEIQSHTRTVASRAMFAGLAAAAIFVASYVLRYV
jgi:hypothetical protein